MKNITKNVINGIILPVIVAGSMYNGFSKEKEIQNPSPTIKIEESQTEKNLTQYTSRELEEIYKEKLKKDKEFLENPEAKKFDLESYTKEKKKKKNIFKNFLTNLKFEFELNYSHKDKLKDVNYEKERIFFQNTPTTDLSVFNNSLNITDAEISQIKNIFNYTKSNEVNSYGDFCREGKKLNENQKIIFLSSTSSMLDTFNYSLENFNTRTSSQDVFFETLQKSLSENRCIPLGKCTHIATHTEKLGEDIGIKIDTICSNNHAYNIAKTENGFVIINYGKITRTKNYNLENLLTAYQKKESQTTFLYYFYDKEKIKHRIVTENGKNFLEAVDYDFSRRPIEKNLINKLNTLEKCKKEKNNFFDYITSPNPDISCKINISNYLKKSKLNIEGFFINGGVVKGNSPMKKLDFYQIGFDKAFCFNEIFMADLNINYIGGSVIENTKENRERKYDISGGMYDLMFIFNGGKKINMNIKSSGIIVNKKFKDQITDRQNNILNQDSEMMIENCKIGGGISYNFSNKYFETSPFLILNSELVPSYLNSGKPKIIIEEYGGGLYFQTKNRPIMLNVKPYFFKKINENEFGCELGIGYSLNDKKFGIKLGVSHSESTYLFNPNKTIIEAGLLSKIGGLEAEINYKKEETSDFKKESKSNQSTYGVKLNYKF